MTPLAGLSGGETTAPAPGRNPARDGRDDDRHGCYGSDGVIEHWGRTQRFRLIVER